MGQILRGCHFLLGVFQKRRRFFCVVCTTGRKTVLPPHATAASVKLPALTPHGAEHEEDGGVSAAGLLFYLIYSSPSKINEIGFPSLNVIWNLFSSATPNAFFDFTEDCTITTPSSNPNAHPLWAGYFAESGTRSSWLINIWAVTLYLSRSSLLT